MSFSYKGDKMDDRCMHCGLQLKLGGNLPGWGLHVEGSQRGKSRCGSESGQPYGLNGHTAASSCSNGPCAGTHVAE